MNLDIWNQLKEPPAWATKKITGGRLNGKSDISPMWRIQVLTETFGMCGIGWKYELANRWTEEGPAGQKLLFVQVNLFVKVDEKWSDAIPGFGGDMIIEKETVGLHANDEALKMAITDALGNAMKNLGVAAVVYSNGIDGTKYNRAGSPLKTSSGTTTPPPAAKPADVTPASPVMASDGQRAQMWKKAENMGWTQKDLADSVYTTYGCKSPGLTMAQGKEYLEWLDTQTDAAKIAAVDKAFGPPSTPAEESLPFPPK